MTQKAIEKTLKFLFHPITFAIGFIAPLSAQSLVALGLMQPGNLSVMTGVAVGLGFGLMAIYRGSWIWIK